MLWPMPTLSPALRTRPTSMRSRLARSVNRSPYWWPCDDVLQVADANASTLFFREMPGLPDPGKLIHRVLDTSLAERFGLVSMDSRRNIAVNGNRCHLDGSPRRAAPARAQPSLEPGTACSHLSAD